jgi:hypothetical protein
MTSRWQHVDILLVLRVRQRGVGITVVPYWPTKLNVGGAMGRGLHCQRPLRQRRVPPGPGRSALVVAASGSLSALRGAE